MPCPWKTKPASSKMPSMRLSCHFFHPQKWDLLTWHHLITKDSFSPRCWGYDPTHGLWPLDDKNDFCLKKNLTQKSLAAGVRLQGIVTYSNWPRLSVSLPLYVQMIPVATAFPLSLVFISCTELHGIAMEFALRRSLAKALTRNLGKGFVGAFNLVSLLQWLSMAKWSNAISNVGHSVGRKLRVQIQHLNGAIQIELHHEHIHLVDAKQLLSLCKTGKPCKALPPAHGGDAYLSPSSCGQNWSRYQGEE